MSAEDPGDSWVAIVSIICALGAFVFFVHACNTHDSMAINQAAACNRIYTAKSLTLEQAREAYAACMDQVKP